MTTVKKLYHNISLIINAREHRDSYYFKDLAIGISTKANELLDIFRFKSDEDMKLIFSDTDKREHVEEEIADILFFVLRFAQRNHIDLSEALLNKIQKNAMKYSVESSRGSNRKYNEQ